MDVHDLRPKPICRADVTPELLVNLLEYHPEVGTLFWRRRDRSFFKSDSSHISWNKRKAGTLALRTKSTGYWSGRVLGFNFLAHRVAWAIYYGCWPKDQIDHINGRRWDNRIENLRDADVFINARNKRLGSRNQSGTFGVYPVEEGKSWDAFIGKKRLGRFATKEEAVFARRSAEKLLGYHPNHGRGG